MVSITKRTFHASNFWPSILPTSQRAQVWSLTREEDPIRHHCDDLPIDYRLQTRSRRHLFHFDFLMISGRLRSAQWCLLFPLWMSRFVWNGGWQWCDQPIRRIYVARIVTHPKTLWWSYRGLWRKRAWLTLGYEIRNTGGGGGVTLMGEQSSA